MLKCIRYCVSYISLKISLEILPTKICFSDKNENFLFVFQVYRFVGIHYNSQTMLVDINAIT